MFSQRDNPYCDLLQRKYNEMKYANKKKGFESKLQLSNILIGQNRHRDVTSTVQNA